MKKLLNRLLGDTKNRPLLMAAQSSRPVVEQLCNYSNNYYGDQLCVSQQLAKPAGPVSSR